MTDIATLTSIAAAVSSLVAIALLLVLVRMTASRVQWDGAIERVVREENSASRSEAVNAASALRHEVQGQMKSQFEFVGQQLQGASFASQQRHDSLRRSLDDRLKTSDEEFRTKLTDFEQRNTQASQELRQTVEMQLRAIREDNDKKLEEIRKTVDEKLQGTLEKRLGEAFKIVGDQLEAVHRGLGEMQTLAASVGDLKKVLSNVKTRGVWGEISLGNLLEQMLTAEQYSTNVAVQEDSGERVEFAIRLPGADGSIVWMPIDAKFPIQDWERLQVAAEAGDADAVNAAGRDLEARIRSQARDISTKYIHPPRTTDFAILFLPTEGLFAEVIRRPGLTDALQLECRIVVAGPTTLSALLNALQMGFRTLAIEQRASEVWQVLGAVKTEFGKFGQVLSKVKRQLNAASTTIDKVGVRERAIFRKLRQVESLPDGASSAVIGLTETDLFDDDEVESHMTEREPVAPYGWNSV